MVFHLIPDHLLGFDSDDLLAYQTPKQAYIRDRNVGCLFYCLTSLALCWVLFGQILWRNEHFMLKDVHGIPRMWISHPTKDLCDPNNADCLATFKPMSALRYCKEYAGQRAEFNANCTYGDKHSMFPEGSLGNNLFLPTSVIVVDEEKHCSPSAENKFSCSNEYKKTDGIYKSDYYFNVTNMQFYADIENYRVQFTSTYHREGIEGTSLQHPGYFYECYDDEVMRGKKLAWDDRVKHKSACKDERRVALDCMPGVECNKGGLKTIKDIKPTKELEKDLQKSREKLESMDQDVEFAGLQIQGAGSSGRALRAWRQHRRGTRGASQALNGVDISLSPDVFASTYGDTFKIGKLLQLADVDLDAHLSVDGESVRMTGVIIDVQVVYSNLRKFLSSLGLSQVQYTYRVAERKLPYVSKESLAPWQPDDYPQTRRYLIQHGIMINFVVTGEFGFFNVVYLLIMLTTALALLGTAHKMTDLSAMYIHPKKENYFHLKYEVSPDFSDMWQCAKCGYWNIQADVTCKGLEKYMSAIDTPYCGHDEPTQETIECFKKAQSRQPSQVSLAR